MLKKLVRNSIRKLGYEVTRIPPPRPADADDLSLAVCAARNVPVIRTPESADAFPRAAPLLPQPARLRVEPGDLRAYGSADEAFVDNTSISRYFRVTRAGGDLEVTDAFESNPYIMRQKMIVASLEDGLGVPDLSGLSVLDIGCSSGYFSFAAARLGARHVLGIDARPEHEEQFKVLRRTVGGVEASEYRHVDMENQLEQISEPVDVVFCMGVLYHVFDHPRFAKNLFRLSKRMAYVAGACSGRADLLCEARIEDPKNLRESIHGPVLFPSVAWTIDVLRWAGFSKVMYQPWPPGVRDAAGHRRLWSTTLLAIK